jgi:hypothetical protein
VRGDPKPHNWDGPKRSAPFSKSTRIRRRIFVHWILKIKQALLASADNITVAAIYLGCHRDTAYTAIARHPELQELGNPVQRGAPQVGRLADQWQGREQYQGVDLGRVHGEFVNYAAIGIWNRPRQWYRQA